MNLEKIKVKIITGYSCPLLPVFKKLDKTTLRLFLKKDILKRSLLKASLFDFSFLQFDDYFTKGNTTFNTLREKVSKEDLSSLSEFIDKNLLFVETTDKGKILIAKFNFIMLRKFFIDLFSRFDSLCKLNGISKTIVFKYFLSKTIFSVRDFIQKSENDFTTVLIDFRSFFYANYDLCLQCISELFPQRWLKNMENHFNKEIKGFETFLQQRIKYNPLGELLPQSDYKKLNEDQKQKPELKLEKKPSHKKRPLPLIVFKKETIFKFDSFKEMLIFFRYFTNFEGFYEKSINRLPNFDAEQLGKERKIKKTFWLTKEGKIKKEIWSGSDDYSEKPHIDKFIGNNRNNLANIKNYKSFIKSLRERATLRINLPTLLFSYFITHHCNELKNPLDLRYFFIYQQDLIDLVERFEYIKTSNILENLKVPLAEPISKHIGLPMESYLYNATVGEVEFIINKYYDSFIDALRKYAENLPAIEEIIKPKLKKDES